MVEKKTLVGFLDNIYNNNNTLWLIKAYLKDYKDYLHPM